MCRIKNSVIYLLLVFWLAGACSVSQENRNEGPKIDAYFDLQGLINQQVGDLSATNTRIQKEAVIDGQREVLELDSLNWKKELNIFARADINKPRLLDQYLTTTYTNDAGYKVTRYQNVEENVSGVIKMEITESPVNQKPLSISIESCEYNTLYISEVELEMVFGEGKNGGSLTAYTINGFEKVILKDTMRYSIKAKVL